MGRTGALTAVRAQGYVATATTIRHLGDQLATAPGVQVSDEERLAQLGYKQDLERRMSGFQNFAISFTIISILSGALTLYGTGINYGGPLQGGVGRADGSLLLVILGPPVAPAGSPVPPPG